MSARSFRDRAAHGVLGRTGWDALEAAGVEPVDSDRLKHVAHIGFATRAFAYRTRGLEPPTEQLYVELVAPSGETWDVG